jgi:hypothetical protein
MDVNEPISGTLFDTETKDYFKFTGQAGQRVVFGAHAQSLVNASDDDTVVDTVLTIYDANEQPIAQDDDAWPRFGRDSQGFTVLPVDGDYYLEVADCNAVLGVGNCAPPAGITVLDYEVYVADTSALIVPEVGEGAEPDNDDPNTTTASVAFVVPQGGMAGEYSIGVLGGGFSSASDHDAFSFTVPNDLIYADGQRPHAEVWVQPIGTKNGTGAATNATYTVLDGTTMQPVAQADQTNYSDGNDPTNSPIRLSVPVTPGQPYFLMAQHDGGASDPVKDFYFARYFVGSFYYATYENETVPLSNDGPNEAQTLSTPQNATTGAYFVDGDLSTPTDLDYFRMAVPPGATQVSLFCDAQRVGSGLRGATFSLLDDAGNPLAAGNVLTETADKDGSLIVQLPGNAPSQIELEVEAKAPADSNVTGRYYNCTIVIAP